MIKILKNIAIIIMLTRMWIHHPKSAVDRLYVPRDLGDRDLIQF